MRAIQITDDQAGPGGVQLVDLDEPTAPHFMTPDAGGVVIEVRSAGVSFPELLQSRGRYQMRPPTPFVPGTDIAGVVRSAPDGAGFAPGDRVFACTLLGGFAEVAVAPVHMTFALPDELDFAQGAALVMNYHTAYFSLVTRGRLQAGEWVLVQGAAGGVGTATIQVAKGLGAKVVAVVSTDAKEAVAREAGADEVVRSDGSWREEVKELSGGGVHLVIDPVGGDRFTDSLRSLRRGGRLAVVGFTEGSIPEVKVNRLLLNNTEVVGAAWGEWALSTPAYVKEAGDAIAELIASGAIRPLIGARFPLEQAADALKLLDERGATGKVVLDVA